MHAVGHMCTSVSLKLTPWRRIACLLLGLFFLSLPLRAGDALVIEIDGPIGPAMADHVQRGMEEAAKRDADVIIIRIDTPGGLVSSTREIIKTILASDRPVVGYVAPSGARAASAGAYILLACHVAVMAPGTNVGSATPVMMGGAPGSPPAGDGTEGAEDHPDMMDKVLNDARAYMRSLAEMRGRPAGPAEKFVSEADNLTASEALERGVIDLVATDMRDMMRKIDGREIKVAEAPLVLATDHLTVETLERTWREEFLAFITNPNIAYLLLMVGIYGLIIEFSNPGLAAPGIAGGVCLIIGLYALQLLPVNYAGLALMALGLALMVAEAFVPTFGALGIGGVASFVIGSIMLIDSDLPEFRLSPVLIGTVSLLTAGLFLFVLTFAVRAWRRPAVSGNDALVGEMAEVLSWRGGTGTVRAHGEVWSARGPENAAPGDKLTVHAIKGLTLDLSSPNPSQAKEADSDD
ncbi:MULTISPECIES: NfeD family protein [Kordiimonas]|uniref:NfeD family protein n=1 Tax=Kordiimonas TaxID=288021 RepID=UPI00257BE36C|nr:nodulation protein NfeD [Kordiimonas sp. UBA4487]